ncbi:hypothetical protein MTO96_020942 [Rhipicephalus appendiculatus]
MRHTSSRSLNLKLHCWCFAALLEQCPSFFVLVVGGRIVPSSVMVQWVQSLHSVHGAPIWIHAGLLQTVWTPVFGSASLHVPRVCFCGLLCIWRFSHTSSTEHDYDDQTCSNLYEAVHKIASEEVEGNFNSFTLADVVVPVVAPAANLGIVDIVLRVSDRVDG